MAGLVGLVAAFGPVAWWLLASPLPGAMTAPAIDQTTVLLAVAVGLPAVLLAGLPAARAGAWLAEMGRQGTGVATVAVAADANAAVPSRAAGVMR